MVLVITKVDLIPKAASLGRLERWVRHRAKAGGLFTPAAVHMVSNTSGMGVQALLASLVRLRLPALPALPNHLRSISFSAPPSAVESGIRHRRCTKTDFSPVGRTGLPMPSMLSCG